MIENDLWQFVPKYINEPQDKLTWHCEQAIRNYDPCISCATHFLKLLIPISPKPEYGSFIQRSFQSSKLSGGGLSWR